jgi:cyanate lyase
VVRGHVRGTIPVVASDVARLAVICRSHLKEDVVTREQATQRVVEARQEAGLTWAALAEAVGRSPVWTTAALLGQAAMSPDEAGRAVSALGLGPEVAAALTRPPMKGALDTTVPVDPLIYRFHEITQVYGTTIKELIHEEFGDGIMSAVDFEMTIERREDPKGDRVVVTMDGKFLRYRTW